MTQMKFALSCDDLEKESPWSQHEADMFILWRGSNDSKIGQGDFTVKPEKATITQK